MTMVIATIRTLRYTQITIAKKVMKYVKCGTQHQVQPITNMTRNFKNFEISFFTIKEFSLNVSAYEYNDINRHLIQESFTKLN